MAGPQDIIQLPYRLHDLLEYEDAVIAIQRNFEKVVRWVQDMQVYMRDEVKPLVINLITFAPEASPPATTTGYILWATTDTKKLFGNDGGVWRYIGTIDHDVLEDLLNDSHTQYLNEARHDTTVRHSLGTVVPHDALDGLTDVTLAAPADGHYLSHDGTDWKNQTIPASDIVGFDEAAQDAVGAALTDTATVDFTYDDAGNQITADVKQSGIDHGSISGLADDDHTQYLNEARHDTTVRHTLGTVVPHDAFTGLTDTPASYTGATKKPVVVNAAENAVQFGGVDVDFGGYKAVAMACDNGTSFPGSPVTGQWFYRTDIDTLFIYEAAWKAIISFGAVTIYVDNTNGTDGIGYGYGSGAAAVKTVQYAVNLIQSISGGNVTVNITAETYNETVTIRGKSFSGNYAITLQGTDGSTVTSGTATSAGSDADTYYLDDSGKAWTINAYAGYLVAITGGTGSGQKRLIESNTATKLRIIGKWDTVPDVTSTYKVYLPGTLINKLNCAVGQTGIVLDTIDINGSGSYVLITGAMSQININYCRMTNLGSAGIDISGKLSTSAFYVSGDGWFFNSETPGVKIVVSRSWFKNGSGTGSDSNITVKNGAMFYPVEGTVISDSKNHGIWGSANAVVTAGWESVVGGRCRIMNNAGWGIYMETGSQARACGNPYYTGNVSGNYSGDAATYAYALV